jgi:sugar (pentulose or hexulose) kinase
MKSSKYSIGVDYGTLSGRAVLVDIADGRELASAEYKYPHGVMDTELPWSGRKLPNDWALQHPQDYLDVLANTIPRLIKDSGIQARDIIGVGVDFTSSTSAAGKKRRYAAVLSYGVQGRTARVCEAVETPRRSAGSQSYDGACSRTQGKMAYTLRRAHLVGMGYTEDMAGA